MTIGMPYVYSKIQSKNESFNMSPIVRAYCIVKSCDIVQMIVNNDSVNE